MKGDKLLMNEKERQRKAILEAVREGYFTLNEASKRIKISYRQTKRIYHRYRKESDAGLIHRSRGRRSKRAYEEGFRNRVIEIYKMNYEGFGPTLACEKLAEEGYCLSHETLRLR